MDESETTPTSRPARFWARASDPNSPPRCWWYPPSSRRNYVLLMQEPRRQGYCTGVQLAHEKFSETIRLAILSLLGFALFCLLITINTPDSHFWSLTPRLKRRLPMSRCPFKVS